MYFKSLILRNAASAESIQLVFKKTLGMHFLFIYIKVNAYFFINIVSCYSKLRSSLYNDTNAVAIESESCFATDLGRTGVTN